MNPFRLLSLAAPLWISAFAVRAEAQTRAQPRTLADSLIQLEIKSWDAWKARDSAFYRTFLSDDHVEVGWSGRSTKAEVLATVATRRCVVQSYKADDFKFTQFDPSSAMLTYHAAQTTLCGGKPIPSPVWVSSLYVRHGGRWLNAAYQQTPVIP